MDYYYKYQKYKSKYIELNKIQTGGDKKCSIEDTDIVLFGDGGSTSIIVITKHNKVYKIFTLYKHMYDVTSDGKIKKIIKNKNKHVMNEIKIYEMITKNIINKNISQHFVKYIGKYKCNNAKKLFNKCPKKYIEFLKVQEDKKSKICKEYYKVYPLRQLINDYNIIEIEYCDYSCSDFIKDLSKMPIIEMEKYLDIFFFQIIYSIMSIQKVYPYFTHNDLFIRNILGKREKDNGNYYTYKFNEKLYYVPQKKFFPKINDFGLTNLNNNYKYFKLYKSNYRDIYNIIYDVYHGGNLGSMSLSELCKDEPDKLKFIKKYFNTFFNTKIIDQYIETSKIQMNRDWGNILDQEFFKSIEMRDPLELLNNYFYDIYKKINSDVLIK